MIFVLNPQCIRITFVNNINKLRRYSTKKLYGMNFPAKHKIWNPCINFTQAELKPNSYSVIILNTPISSCFNPCFIINLWKQAKVRITVDGGTQQWLTWLTTNQGDFKDIPHPDLITGDMDSISQDTINYYNGISKTKIIKTEDQDETDYYKALKELKNYCEAQNLKLDTIYVLADTCGRLDQILGNINTLYKCKKLLGEVEVFQIAASSLSWLLDPGSHLIQIPEQLRDNNDWCALLPIGGPCMVSTNGLKWDLDKEKLEFGGLVSSSNTYGDINKITIETNAPLLWSMSVYSLL